MILLTNKMEPIHEIVIDDPHEIININSLPDDTTHIRIYLTEYTDPILNLPSSLKYFRKDYANINECYEGFGELNQIDNFPHGLEVLILHIDKFRSFLNLPSSLEFIAIMDGYKMDEELEMIKSNKIKPIIIIPFNVKTFITTKFINNLYQIKMENKDTKLIIYSWSLTSKSQTQLIHDNLPEKYRDYYSKTTLIKPNH